MNHLIHSEKLASSDKCLYCTFFGFLQAPYNWALGKGGCGGKGKHIVIYRIKICHNPLTAVEFFMLQSTQITRETETEWKQ